MRYVYGFAEPDHVAEDGSRSAGTVGRNSLGQECGKRGVPALRRDVAVSTDAEAWIENTSRPLEVPCVPEAIYRHGRHDFRSLARLAGEVVAGDSSARVEQERHQRASDPPQSKGVVSDRVVHGASSPLRDDA